MSLLFCILGYMAYFVCLFAINLDAFCLVSTLPVSFYVIHPFLHLFLSRYMAAGGAATSLPVLQFFEDIGIPIMEGYGLTETSPIVTAGEFLLLCYSILTILF